MEGAQRQPSVSSKAPGKLRRSDDTKASMSNRTAKYEERVQLHTALRPAVCCKLAMLCPKMQATSRQETNSEQKCFEHGGEDLTDAYEASGR